MQEYLPYLWLVAAFTGGLLIAYILVQSRLAKAQSELQEIQQKNALNKQSIEQQNQFLAAQLQEVRESLRHSQEDLEDLRREHQNVQQKVAKYEQQISEIPKLQNEKQSWQDKSEATQTELASLKSELQAQQARHEEENKSNEEKLSILQKAESRLQEQFENLANKIFQQKTEKFTESNKAGMDALLTPLKEQIEGFKKQVSDQHIREGQERATLKTEILNLKELNQRITEEAAALTRALKGDNKQQGNWGELVLEKILQDSGLREGHEFETQEHLKDESGKSYQPDVVVHLPQNKDVIIDSKVSLAAYEQYFNESDEDLKAQFLKEHVNSLRTHIKELGKKDYQQLVGVRTLDYVLMFVPIEPAYLTAMEQSPDLVKLAMDNNIMLVSPTNLMVALRTINNIWQYEYQNQNAQSIAKKAGLLYDKFHGFVADMEKLGRSLKGAQDRFDDATRKLSTGPGNLVRKAEEFKKMGVQSSKKLDENLLQKALEDET